MQSLYARNYIRSLAYRIFFHQQKIKQVKSNESNEIMFRRFGDFMKLLIVIHEKRIGYMNRKLKEYVLLLPNLLLVL